MWIFDKVPPTVILTLFGSDFLPSLVLYFMCMYALSICKYNCNSMMVKEEDILSTWCVGSIAVFCMLPNYVVIALSMFLLSRGQWNDFS